MLKGGNEYEYCPVADTTPASGYTRLCASGMCSTRSGKWRGRLVRWGRMGSGPDVVFCHKTPWSSWLWMPFATASTNSSDDVRRSVDGSARGYLLWTRPASRSRG